MSISKALFRLSTALQNALDEVIDENKYLRKRLDEKNNIMNSILEEIEHISEVEGYTSADKVYLILLLARKNKKELDMQSGKRV